MKRGAIAHFTEPGGEIDTSDYPKRGEKDGFELLSSLSKGEPYQDQLDSYEDPQDQLFIETARAAQDHVVETQSPEIKSDGEILLGEERKEKATQITEILHVKGEFIVTESTDCDFAYPMVEDATGGKLEESVLNLGSFANKHPDADIWLGGFYGRDAPVEKGVHIGDISRDQDAQEFISESEINRLGIRNLTYNNRSLKLLITESGYLEIYGNNVETVEFVKFIRDLVMPHIKN